MRLLWARAGRTFCPNGGTQCRDAIRSIRSRSKMLRAAGRIALVRCCSPVAARIRARMPCATRAVRSSRARFQPALSERQCVRILDTGVAARHRLLKACVRSGRPSGDSPDQHQRIVDTAGICYREAGEVFFEDAASGEPRFASASVSLQVCGTNYRVPEPSLFSFNNPAGACRCVRASATRSITIIGPDYPGLHRSRLKAGAVDPWTKPQLSLVLQPKFKQETKGKVRLSRPSFETLIAMTSGFVRSRIYSRFISRSRAEEIQSSCACFPEPLSRVHDCPACRRSRLRSGGFVRAFGGPDIAGSLRHELSQSSQDFFDHFIKSRKEEIADRGKVLVEIRQRLQVFERCRTRILDAGSLIGNALRREAQRIRSRPALDRAWWAPLMFSTTVHRSAQPRYRPIGDPERPARSGQHDHRCGARPRNHRRSGLYFNLRPRSRRKWRACHLRRNFIPSCCRRRRQARR